MPDQRAEEKGVEALELAICQAWMANADEVYPRGAEGPDPKAQARVAATAAWAFFFNVLDAKAHRNPREKA